MKKTLDLILVYLFILIVGIISSTFLYSFYINVLNFIAGEESAYFTNEALISSLIYSSYCILLFICPVISYYRIRRPAGISQTIGFIIVSLITWFVLFPGVCHVKKYLSLNSDVRIEQTHLSKGYFRKIDNKVYYFTKDFESENNNTATSSALIINTSETGGVEYKTVRDISSMEYNKKAKPFRDVLVKQNFDNSRITLPVDFNNLISRLSKALDLKLYYLLYFISFILVICSVYALTNFFSWRLLNAVLIFFVTVALVSANSSDSLFGFSALKNLLSDTKLFAFLSNYIYESVLFVFNSLLSLIFIVIGIVKFAIHTHAKNK